MRDRLAEPGDWAGAAGAGRAAVDGQAHGEAFNALVALGYKPADASRMVRAVDAEGLGTEEIIRSALQSMVK